MSSRRTLLSFRFALVAAVVAVAAALPARSAGAAVGTLVSACGGTIGCPNKINLRGAVNTITFQAKLTPTTPLSPATETFAFMLSNAHGVIFAGSLSAGQLHREGRRYQYRNQNARTVGGFSRVTLRPTKGSSWRLTVIAHGNLSAATLATMSVDIAIGNDTFATINPWSPREFGWLLHLPAGPNPPPTPTPSPTPHPTATPTPGGPTATPHPTPSPTPTPAPTQTPVPTPTENPYGSVFGAFVQPPRNLLR